MRGSADINRYYRLFCEGDDFLEDGLGWDRSCCCLFCLFRSPFFPSLSKRPGYEELFKRIGFLTSNAFLEIQWK